MVDKPRGYVSSVSETALDLTRIRDFALRIRHTNCCYSYGMPCPEGPRRGPKVMPGGNGPAPSAELVGGIAEHTFTCGDPQVQVGHYYHGVGNYGGAEGFAASESTEDIEFSCVPAED